MGRAGAALAVLGLILVLAALFMPGMARLLAFGRPGPESRTVLTIWSSPTGVEERAFKKLIARYMREYPGIQVKNVGALDEGRTIRAILAGTPPDLLYVYGTGLVGPLAANGAVMALDELFRQSGFRAKDFLPAAIAQGSYRGHLYAMPVTRDTLAFYWNRKLFRQAGLDPDRPPKTLEELSSMAVRLTKTKEDGSITRLGLLPPDDVPALMAAMGARFYDEATGRITANTPEMAAALRWLQGIVDRQGGFQAINRFRAGFGSDESSYNPFYIDRIAMKFDGEWFAMHIEKYAPHLDYRVAPIPYPARHPKLAHMAWQSGDVIMIPTGASHPKEAWQFIRWLQMPSQQEEYAAGMNNLPSIRSLLNSPGLTQGSKCRETLGYILRNIATGSNARFFPSLPVSQFYQTLLSSQTEMVLSHRKTPEEALSYIQEKVQGQMAFYEEPSHTIRSSMP